MTTDTHRRSVVFSYWTRTLDIVQSALIASSITYTRVDGKVPPGKRETALQSFREQAAVSVLLISISCGGTGLDLTAASRVYLLEPQWNPMIEEQALNRVHRMGQTKDVTTIRYIMENSIEEVMLSDLDCRILLTRAECSRSTGKEERPCRSNTIEFTHDRSRLGG